MKTTIKCHMRDIVVSASSVPGYVDFNLMMGNIYTDGLCLTQDQCGELIFAIEQAAEAARQRADFQASPAGQMYAANYAAKAA